MSIEKTQHKHTHTHAHTSTEYYSAMIKEELYHLPVYLDNGGVVWQDLGLVRPAYTISEDGDILSHQDKVDILVWSDETAEDYTHQFIVPIYEDKDAPPEKEQMPEEVIEYLNEEDKKNG